MSKIAIIFTTFLRDRLAAITLSSIQEHRNKNYILLIGDQGIKNERSEAYNLYPPDHYKRFVLPFDCGLSYARNFLVKKAQELNIKYCWITADSIQFTDKYDLNPVIDFMEQHPRAGVVGFNLQDRVPWECDLELIEGSHFLLKAPTREPIIHEGIKFQQADIVRNFFLAKTECLLHNPWDEKLKLLEHEDWAWRFKNNSQDFTKEYGADIYQPYQIFYINSISAKYIGTKPEIYNRYRNRMYNEFREILKEKYNLTGYVQYDKGLKKIFEEFHRRQRGD